MQNVFDCEHMQKLGYITAVSASLGTVAADLGNFLASNHITLGLLIAFLSFCAQLFFGFKKDRREEDQATLKRRHLKQQIKDDGGQR